MFIARAAAIRPPGSILLQLGKRGAPRCQSSLVLLRLDLTTNGQPEGGALGILSAARQCRFQSTQPTSKKDSQHDPNRNGGGTRPRPQPVPLRQIPGLIGRIMWGSFRNIGSIFRGQSFKALFRQHPEEMVLGLLTLACAAAILVYVIQVYFTYFYSEQFTRYPEPVAKALRRALYYSNYKPDPKLALKYYKLALELCDELNLDPFSDDVMGIKIQLAAWLEKAHNHQNAANVLETLLGDCKRWVQVMEKTVKERSSSSALMLPGHPDDVPETLWGKRSRVLGKAVGISVKLADLYSDEHLVKPELAHERLLWAVETALGELRRRSVEGVKEAEGEWMSAEQIGATLESLGQSYEAKSQFHLALPLFFQALRLCQDQCHSAVLMNNIATSFAQHPILASGDAPVDAMTEPPNPSATPAERRASYLEAARRWASNANQHAAEPQGDKRTTECDSACAISLCNLADIASLTGDNAKARQLFEQAIAMCKKAGFEPGITQAEAGLRALSTSIP
ncbi:hypothetical protein B0H63DRAFT_310829 [Podospora didyma]|uniref:Uncharacterized protein n=1 Tax=Podospora didyma TaxID=330526 RepID=A0AAE0K696_9PEZI|nr:hypothetical protein B0H63DRAFT_310829 [Podospora didyma]